MLIPKRLVREGVRGIERDGQIEIDRERESESVVQCYEL
jgi:hypothetical protein